MIFILKKCSLFNMNLMHRIVKINIYDSNKNTQTQSIKQEQHNQLPT